MPKRVIIMSAALGLVASVLIAPELANAQEPQYELAIGYRLPDNPDLATQARAAESNQLEHRAVSLQACSRGTNQTQCEHQAEQAFREGLASIPGVRFGLYVNHGDNNSAWLLDLTDSEAVDPDLDRDFGHLEPGNTHVYWMGIHVDMDNCEIIRDSDDSRVNIDESTLVNTICSLVKNNQNATQMLDSAVERDEVWEVKFLLERGAGTDAANLSGSPAVDANPKFFGPSVSCSKLDKPVSSLIIGEAGPARAVSAITNVRTQSFALFGAATVGDVNLLRTMMDDGVNLNGVTGDGGTALMYAAAANKPNAVTFLLAEGADIEARDSLGATAVISAAINGATDALKVLRRHGASLSIMDNDGRGALEWAACAGRTTTAAYLLSHGADVNARDRYGWTSLIAAAATGQDDVVRLLLRHKADVRISSKDGVAALLAAALSDHPSTVGLLLDHGADVDRNYECEGEECRPWFDGNWPAIVWALQAGHYEVARVLSAHGANINAASYQGYTALSYATENLILGLLDKLLNFGADVNSKDTDGQTPLIRAAMFGNEYAAKALLNHGADINAADLDGWTALMEAADSGHADVVSLLVNSGAKLGAKGFDGKTALIIAASYPRLEIVKVLIDHGAAVNAADDRGTTPLMTAAYYDAVDVVNLLLKRGADANIRNSEGKTALDIAKAQGNNDIVSVIETYLGRQ